MKIYKPLYYLLAILFFGFSSVSARFVQQERKPLGAHPVMHAEPPKAPESPQSGLPGFEVNQKDAVHAVAVPIDSIKKRMLARPEPNSFEKNSSVDRADCCRCSPGLE